MDLSHFSDQEILSRLGKLVRTERKITHVILWHINEVDSRRLYAEAGFDSLFKFLTKHHGYAEDGAYRRIRAAQLLRKAPEVAEKLENGSLNLTQLTQVQSCLRQERKIGNVVDSAQTLQILEQIENKSSFETKKVLAVEFNQPIQVREIVKPQRDESVRLEITLTEEQMRVLSQAKDLLSHVLPDGNWADVISYLAEKQIQKTFGKNGSPFVSTGKEKENKNKKLGLEVHAISSSQCESSNSKPIATQSFMAKQKRQHINITDRRLLLQKADHCCEYIDQKTNARCKSTYQLQIDHRIPLARGGVNSCENLRVLCRTHNLLEAKHWGL